MAEKINQKHEKEIIALDIFDAIRLRSNMYIGQISPIDDKLPIVKDGKLIQMDKLWSPGFMHLIVEILENSIDEAKRMKGKMKNIFVSVNLDTNEVTIQDEGNGFHKAHAKHSKTKKNVVRTAMEELHAGSNFTETEDHLIGTNGVGSAIVNILSKSFKVKTINKTHIVDLEWDDFKIIKEKISKTNKDKTGTITSFIPSPEVFHGFEWDKEIIQTYLSFKNFLIKSDQILKNLNISGTFVQDNKEFPIEISTDFLPKDTIIVEDKNYGSIIFWESYEDSCSLSFVNGSQCTGIHQKIVNDWINELFNYNLAHHFYNTLISFTVPSRIMRFADQNKTKYAVARFEIEEILEKSFKQKILRKIKGSDIEKNIIQNIEDRLYNENIKKIKKAQKNSKRKISDKYSPPSKKKETIYLVEGNCLEENTKIFIIRKNNIISKKIKDVKESDLVITHKNKIQEIDKVIKKSKKGVKIQFNNEKIICSEDHKWLIYDIIENKFYFEESKNLIKERHKLVKNYLAFINSFDEIIEIDLNKNDEVIHIINDKKEKTFLLRNKKYCIYDLENNEFKFILSDNLKKGDILSTFCI